MSSKSELSTSDYRIELCITAQIIAHSVGTWVAFEFMHAARAAGLPMPCRAFLSAMAAPDLPEAERPWRCQRDLLERDFQVRRELLFACAPFLFAHVARSNSAWQLPLTAVWMTLIHVSYDAGGVPRVGCQRGGVHASAVAHISRPHASRLPAV